MAVVSAPVIASHAQPAGFSIRRALRRCRRRLSPRMHNPPSSAFAVHCGPVGAGYRFACATRRVQHSRCMVAPLVPAIASHTQPAEFSIRGAWRRCWCRSRLRMRNPPSSVFAVHCGPVGAGYRRACTTRRVQHSRSMAALSVPAIASHAQPAEFSIRGAWRCCLRRLSLRMRNPPSSAFAVHCGPVGAGYRLACITRRVQHAGCMGPCWCRLSLRMHNSPDSAITEHGGDVGAHTARMPTPRACLVRAVGLWLD